MSSTPSVVPSSVTAEGRAADRESATTSTPARARLEWLDFYRGLAVLVMIETHVGNTFLATTYRSAGWWTHLNYVNGLVAPAFLFIAGYAHGLGLRRKRAVRSHIGPRLQRLAGIAAIGYAMHFPVVALFRGEWGEAWRVGTQMDVLLCLAFSIAALVVIERVCGRLTRFAVWGVWLAVLSAGPHLVQWVGGPVPLVAAVNQMTGSLFPLLPWAAFVFCGFDLSVRRPSFFGVIGSVVGAAAMSFATTPAVFSAVSASFFLERAAWVVTLVPIAAWLSARWSPRVVLFAGRESFVVYLVHLGLIEVLAVAGRNRLGLVATVALYPAVLAASFAVAHAWRTFTVARADRARRAAHLRESSAPAA